MIVTPGTEPVLRTTGLTEREHRVRKRSDEDPDRELTRSIPRNGRTLRGEN